MTTKYSHTQNCDYKKRIMNIPFLIQDEASNQMIVQLAVHMNNISS